MKSTPSHLNATRIHLQHQNSQSIGVSAPRSDHSISNGAATCFSRRLLGILVTGLLGWTQIAYAEDPASAQKDQSTEIIKSTVKPGRGATKKSAVEPLTPKREATLNDFAKQHHPELASLLQTLKTKSPDDYQAALFDLDRSVDRLLKSQEKTPEKFTAQLAEWKNTSRIRLLEARLVVTDDRSVEGELRSALTERLKMKLAAQESDKERLQKRLEKLDQSINELKSSPDAIIDKEISELRKKTPSAKAAPRTRTKKPADAVPAKNPESMK